MTNHNSLPSGFVLRSKSNTYTIERVLGSGGFGITYSARTMIKFGNIPCQATVAIKEFFLQSDAQRAANTGVIMPLSNANGRLDRARKDFINEAERLKKLSNHHPNIVRVNEVFECNNTAYYVMEYLPGQNLAEYIKCHGPISEVETLSMITPIVDALALLHKHSTTHLDVKPANIMLTHDEHGATRPVLIDFGLSKHFDNNGEPTSIINTQGYSEGFAPEEQYAGLNRFSPASDVYSVAATMVYCLTGKILPCAIGLQPSTIKAMLPPTLSPWMQNILMSALATHAIDRTPDAIALLQQLSERPTMMADNFQDDDDDRTVAVTDSNGNLIYSGGITNPNRSGNAGKTIVGGGNGPVVPPIGTKNPGYSIPKPGPIPKPTIEKKQQNKRNTLLTVVGVVLVALASAVVTWMFLRSGNGSGSTGMADSAAVDTVALSPDSTIAVAGNDTQDSIAPSDSVVPVESAAPAPASIPKTKPTPAPKPAKAKTDRTPRPTTPTVHVPDPDPYDNSKSSNDNPQTNGSDKPGIIRKPKQNTGTLRRNN